MSTNSKPESTSTSQTLEKEPVEQTERASETGEPTETSSERGPDLSQNRQASGDNSSLARQQSEIARKADKENAQLSATNEDESENIAQPLNSTISREITGTAAPPGGPVPPVERAANDIVDEIGKALDRVDQETVDKTINQNDASIKSNSTQAAVVPQVPNQVAPLGPGPSNPQKASDNDLKAQPTHDNTSVQSDNKSETVPDDSTLLDINNDEINRILKRSWNRKIKVSLQGAPTRKEITAVIRAHLPWALRKLRMAKPSLASAVIIKFIELYIPEEKTKRQLLWHCTSEKSLTVLIEGLRTEQRLRVGEEDYKYLLYKGEDYEPITRKSLSQRVKTRRTESPKARRSSEDNDGKDDEMAEMLQNNNPLKEADNFTNFARTPVARLSTCKIARQGSPSRMAEWTLNSATIVIPSWKSGTTIPDNIIPTYERNIVVDGVFRPWILIPTDRDFNSNPIVQGEVRYPSRVIDVEVSEAEYQIINKSKGYKVESNWWLMKSFSGLKLKVRKRTFNWIRYTTRMLDPGGSFPRISVNNGGFKQQLVIFPARITEQQVRNMTDPVATTVGDFKFTDYDLLERIDLEKQPKPVISCARPNDIDFNRLGVKGRRLCYKLRRRFVPNSVVEETKIVTNHRDLIRYSRISDDLKQKLLNFLDKCSPTSVASALHKWGKAISSESSMSSLGMYTFPTDFADVDHAKTAEKVDLPDAWTTESRGSLNFDFQGRKIKVGVWRGVRRKLQMPGDFLGITFRGATVILEFALEQARQMMNRGAIEMWLVKTKTSEPPLRYSKLSLSHSHLYFKDRGRHKSPNVYKMDPNPFEVTEYNKRMSNTRLLHFTPTDDATLEEVLACKRINNQYFGEFVTGGISPVEMMITTRPKQDFVLQKSESPYYDSFDYDPDDDMVHPPALPLDPEKAHHLEAMTKSMAGRSGLMSPDMIRLIMHNILAVETLTYNAPGEKFIPPALLIPEKLEGEVEYDWIKGLDVDQIINYVKRATADPKQSYRFFSANDFYTRFSKGQYKPESSEEFKEHLVAVLRGYSRSAAELPEGALYLGIWDKLFSVRGLGEYLFISSPLQDAFAPHMGQGRCNVSSRRYWLDTSNMESLKWHISRMLDRLSGVTNGEKPLLSELCLTLMIGRIPETVLTYRERLSWYIRPNIPMQDRPKRWSKKSQNMRIKGWSFFDPEKTKEIAERRYRTPNSDEEWESLEFIPEGYLVEVEHEDEQSVFRPKRFPLPPSSIYDSAYNGVRGWHSTRATTLKVWKVDTVSELTSMRADRAHPILDRRGNIIHSKSKGGFANIQGPRTRTRRGGYRQRGNQYRRRDHGSSYNKYDGQESSYKPDYDHWEEVSPQLDESGFDQPRKSRRKRRGGGYGSRGRGGRGGYTSNNSRNHDYSRTDDVSDDSNTSAHDRPQNDYFSHVNPKYSHEQEVSYRGPKRSKRPPGLSSRRNRGDNRVSLSLQPSGDDVSPDDGSHGMKDFGDRNDSAFRDLTPGHPRAKSSNSSMRGHRARKGRSRGGRRSIPHPSVTPGGDKKTGTPDSSDSESSWKPSPPVPAVAMKKVKDTIFSIATRADLEDSDIDEGEITQSFMHVRTFAPLRKLFNSAAHPLGYYANGLELGLARHEDEPHNGFSIYTPDTLGDYIKYENAIISTSNGKKRLRRSHWICPFDNMIHPYIAYESKHDNEDVFYLSKCAICGCGLEELYQEVSPADCCLSIYLQKENYLGDDRLATLSLNIGKLGIGCLSEYSHGIVADLLRPLQSSQRESVRYLVTDGVDPSSPHLSYIDGLYNYWSNIYPRISSYGVTPRSVTGLDIFGRPVFAQCCVPMLPMFNYNDPGSFDVNKSVALAHNKYNKFQYLRRVRSGLLKYGVFVVSGWRLLPKDSKGNMPFFDPISRKYLYLTPEIREFLIGVYKGMQDVAEHRQYTTALAFLRLLLREASAQ